MSSGAAHLWISGERAAGRSRLAEAAAGPADISVNCHRGLRGPYSGTCVLLNAVVPTAMGHCPGLVAEHQACLLYAAPDLARVTGPAPPIVTFSTPHEERTRFFGVGYVRAVSQGIVTFLGEYTRRHSSATGKPLTVFFDNAHEADPTEQEFLELALRRIQPDCLRLLVGTGSSELPGRLAAALRAYARPAAIGAPAGPALPPAGPAGLSGGASGASNGAAAGPASDERLAMAYIEADGTSDDPELLSAYQRSAPQWRAARHDARADALEAAGDWNLRLGAIPYHRERGADPSGKGRKALLSALEHCMAMGFYAALYDFGRRGTQVADSDTQQQEYCQFRAKMASAAIALGRPEEAERILLGLRERYALPKVHMSTSYNLAMLYTRWFSAEAKDHDLAKGYCNNAIALATGEPDPELRAFSSVFQRNGLALVEMHRGNLAEALRLVSEGMQRLDRELPAGKYVVHRWQLMHNRARVLVALGRLDEAMADFGRLVDGDPNYTEYYIDRGNTARKIGDDTTALADYSRACELGIPFPEVYYNRGDMLAAGGAVAEAIRDFAYVLDMEPDYLDARIGHAELLIDSGDLAAATASLAEGIARHPGNAALYTLDGLAALLTGDTARARDRLDTALSLDPGLAAAWAHRAVLAAEAGDPGRAVTDFTRALDLLGDDPDLRYQRGLAHLALGNQAEATADLRAAASGEAEHAADAREKLAGLAAGSPAG